MTSKTNKASKTNHAARVLTDPAYKAGLVAGRGAKAAAKVTENAVEFLRSQADGDGNIPKTASQQFRAGYIVARGGVAVYNKSSSDAERKRYVSAANTILSRARKSFELETGKTAAKDARGGNRKGKASAAGSKAPSAQAAFDVLLAGVAKRKAKAAERTEAHAHLEALAAFLGLDSGK